MGKASSQVYVSYKHHSIANVYQMYQSRRKQHVYLSKIQDCQMISFENQLSHVIFSHCKYSLKAGHGADITYDFVALEKHILDRFVRGKPLITCDIPIMSYRSDVLEATTFMKIRKTITQVSSILCVVFTVM